MTTVSALATRGCKEARLPYPAKYTLFHDKSTNFLDPFSLIANKLPKRLDTDETKRKEV